MTRHGDFVEDRVKTKKGTPSEGVTEKDTRTEFEIEFVGRIGTQQLGENVLYKMYTPMCTSARVTSSNKVKV